MSIYVYFPLSTPPCARYEGGEDDQRLNAVWTYVVGLLGGRSASSSLSRKVARLFDFKGQLVVALRETLSQREMACFAEAWADVGCEPEDNVEFLDVRSSDWEKYWNGRRFDSDWRAFP